MTTDTTDTTDGLDALTLAEQVAARLDYDGLRWTTEDGIGLDALARVLNARIDHHPHTARWHTYAYRFPDGSAITVAGDGWDLGYPDCWCWASWPHGTGANGAARCTLLGDPDDVRALLAEEGAA